MKKTTEQNHCFSFTNDMNFPEFVYKIDLDPTKKNKKN